MTKVDEFASLTSAGDAVRSLLDTPEARRAMGPARQAQRAWMQVNGPVEREHTCGTFLAKPRRLGEAPLFVVYTDTRARAVDFNANREVYRARMAAAGWEFSDITFKQDRRPASERAKKAARPQRPAAPELPRLTESEERQARDAVAELPEKLREKVYKAMCASLRRDKADSSRNGAKALREP